MKDDFSLISEAIGGTEKVWGDACPISQVRAILASGDISNKGFELIVEVARQLSTIESAAIFFRQNHGEESSMAIVSMAGEQSVPYPSFDGAEVVTPEGTGRYFSFYSLGERVGLLGVVAKDELSALQLRFLEQLSFYSGILFERQILCGRLQDVEHQCQQALAQVAAAVPEPEVKQVIPERKGAFISSISHELRTPLTAIIGYSKIMADGLYGDISEMQREALTSITRSSEYLHGLLEDILELSKIATGEAKAEPVAVPLRTVVNHVMKLMLQNARKKDIRLQLLPYSEEAEDSLLYADPRHVRQVLMGVFANAIKCTPDGGAIRILADVNGSGSVVISVSDKGPGFSEEKQASIFQIDEAKGLEQDFLSDTGVTLPVAKLLAELNGGSMSLSSREGQGSTFTLVLPCSTVEEVSNTSVSDSTPVVKPRPSIEGAKILIVDDNLENCRMLKSALDFAGADSVIASSAREAKKLVQEVSADLAFIDLAMPEEDGFSLISYLKSHVEESISSIPLVVLSAYNQEEDKQRSFELGACDYILKPYQVDQIINAIATFRHRG